MDQHLLGSISGTEAFQLGIKWHKVNFLLEHLAALLVSLHVPHQLHLCLSTSWALWSLSCHDYLHTVACVWMLILEDLSPRLLINRIRRPTIEGTGVRFPSTPCQPGNTFLMYFWVLWGTFGYLWVLLGTLRYFWVPWGTFGYFVVILSTFRFFWVLWVFLRYFCVFWGIYWYFEVLQGNFLHLYISGLSLGYFWDILLVG